MTQVFFVAVLAFILGLLAFYLTKKLRRTESLLKEKNKELEKRLYEISVSQAISNQIGYSLKLTTIIESIAGTIEKVIEHSAVSYALIDQRTIVCKIYENAFIGPNFKEAVKKSLVETIEEQVGASDYQVIESTHKDIFHSTTEYNNNNPASLLTIPLIINHACVGAISVASVTPNAFSEEDRALLSRIIENTSSAIGSLEQVINTEKGKLDSFLFSLTSGAVLFLLDNATIKLSAINSAAKQFLHLDDNVDATSVIAHFGMHYDLVKDIREVADKKESMLLKDITIYDKFFKIYLNPVFLHDSQEVLGVSITMEDVTFEREIEEIRETFTNMVVHELRAPLTSIKGASSMLLAGKLNAEDTQKMLRIIHDSTERMLMDIGDVLDVAKLEAGKFTLNTAVGNINNLIKEKALAFSFMAQERHIKLEDRIDTQIPDSVFDQQRIGQVVNNLLSNALKFTPDNGTITISTRLQNNQIEVSVQDSGQGVPPEKMALLFSKYGQLGTAVRHEGGTGLGLYISKGIVESHNGKIWLENTVKNGATFSFMIPLVKAETVNPSASKISPQRVVN